jgi:hypothetical protein
LKAEIDQKSHEKRENARRYFIEIIILGEEMSRNSQKKVEVFQITELLISILIFDT